MRNRINRTRSTIATRYIREQDHLLLWLNAERQALIFSLYSISTQNLSQKYFRSFQKLEEVWNSAFLQKLLISISEQYFTDKFASIHTLIDHQQHISDPYIPGSSKGSFHDNRQYQDIIQRIQKYLKYQLGKMLSVIFPTSLINIAKLISLVLFLCISCSQKKDKTARIILSLPTNTQNFLHNQIKILQTQYLQPIQQYKQIVKMMMQLEEQNLMLTNNYKDLKQSMKETNRLLLIKDQQLKQLRNYCEQIQKHCQQLYEQFSVGSLDEVKQFCSQIMHNYNQQIHYASKLTQQNSILNIQITKINTNICDREKVIVQLSQQLQQYRSQRSIYSSLFQNFKTTASILNFSDYQQAMRQSLISKLPTQVDKQQKFIVLQKLSKTHYHKPSQASTNPSQLLMNNPLNVNSTGSSFNSQTRSQMSEMIHMQQASSDIPDDHNYNNRSIQYNFSDLGCESFYRQKQHAYKQKDDNIKQQQFEQGVRSGSSRIKKSRFIQSDDGKISCGYNKMVENLNQQIEQLRHQNMNLCDKVVYMEDKLSNAQRKIKKMIKTYYWLCDKLNIDTKQYEQQQQSIIDCQHDASINGSRQSSHNKIVIPY